MTAVIPMSSKWKRVLKISHLSTYFQGNHEGTLVACQPKLYPLSQGFIF